VLRAENATAVRELIRPCVRFLMAQHPVRAGKEGSMETRMVVLITTALTVWAPVGAGPAAAGGIRLAQLSGETPIGAERSPRVIIEEPRPSTMAIETEGRGERHDCRAVTTTERQNGLPVRRTEQLCGR
jgi:hypothetical protein